MASLKTLFQGSSGSQAAVEEALPTYFAHSQYNTSTYSCSVGDSYGNIIHSGYRETDSEGHNNYATPSHTYYSGGGYGYITSNGDGAYCWNQATPNSQSEGHYRYWYPTNSMMYASVVRPYSNHSNSYWPYFGTVIGLEGKRQKISIYNQNNTMDLWVRGAYGIETVSINSATYLTTGDPATTSYGMNSYNSRTQTLCLIRGNGSNQYRIHVWKNPNIQLDREGVRAGDLHNFLSQAKAGTGGASYFYNDFTWSTSGSSSYNEARYHFRVIMGDNGRVGLVRMTPSNETHHAWIQPNPASTSLTSGPTTVSTMSLTTSYGIEQGNPYGMRSVITWDNKTIACFSPYYYYGSGLNMHIVSTVDPSTGYYYQWSDTSYGFAVFPFGKSHVAHHYTGYNNNGSGGFLYVELFDAETPRLTGRQNNSAQSAISNGGSLSGLDAWLSTDVGYTSTNYPHVGGMQNWKKVNY